MLNLFHHRHLYDIILFLYTKWTTFLYRNGIVVQDGPALSRHRKGRQGESQFFIYESNRHVDEEEDEGVHHMYAFAQ